MSQQQSRKPRTMLDTSVVVIRSSNERTFELCKRLCLGQFPEKNLRIVQEVPFEKALRTCYEIGIESQKKWMVTVDADVLLAEKAIETLICNIEMLPECYFQLEGRIFDKITGLYRQAGHRIYRTEWLPFALEHIPIEGKEVRPEFATLQKMGQLGFPSRRIPDVLGVHDFEQCYADLYRKSFVHAIKHPHWVNDLINRCSVYLHGDLDFLVILKGLCDGMVSDGQVSIDKRKFEALGNIALEDLGLQEKIPIKNVDTIVKNFQEFFIHMIDAHPVTEFLPADAPVPSLPTQGGDMLPDRHKGTVYNVLKKGLSVLGCCLVRLGNYLETR